MKQPSIISILTFLYFITSSIMATNWKLLETNYAKVYYPATHKQLAIETAYYLEKNRKKVQTLSGLESPYKLYITLQDLGMMTNGYSLQETNKISVFTPAPGSLIGETFDYNWLEGVTIHEQFHNYHAHNAKGVSKIIKPIIGNWNPHLSLPIMMTEGLAVYQESQITPYQGRLNTGYHDAILLTKAKENKLMTFTQSNLSTSDFPMGQWYIYGGNFIQYLTNTYSEQSITTFINNYAKKFAFNPLLLFPKYGIDNKNIYPKSFKDLYQDFTLDLKEQSKTWILPTNAISRGSHITSPVSDTNTIYTIKTITNDSNPYTPHTSYHLVAINNKTKEETLLKIFYAAPIQNPLVLQDNILYIGLTEYKKEFPNISMLGYGKTVSILSYNLKTKVLKKKTNDTLTAFMVNDNHEIIYAKQIPGKHETKLIQANTKTILASHPLYITALQSTNKGIIVTAKEAEGSSNIYTLENNYTTLTPLIATHYIEKNPFIAKDWLYFTANYKKRFQIYRQNITNKTIEKINGPSFMTKASVQNNDITYVSLDSKSMTLNQQSITTTSTTLPKQESITKPNQTNLYKLLDYKIYDNDDLHLKNLKTLTPYLRVPLLLTVNNNVVLGGVFIGEDKLGIINYNIIAYPYNNAIYLPSLTIQTTILQPVTIQYNKILDEQTLSASAPIYLSQINNLQSINADITTTFDTIQTGIQVNIKKGLAETTLAIDKRFNNQNSFSLLSKSYYYADTSELSLTIHNNYKKTVTLNKRGVLKQYYSITDTSWGIDYTYKLKSINKSFYQFNTYIDTSYINVFIEHIPYYSQSILSGIEYLTNYYIGSSKLVYTVGLRIDPNKDSTLYFSSSTPF
ncbi:MAG: hypothetical protein CMP21_07655 [Rickettsiales bacterium]|nr:hypothetical protein [Rickettsiales bacterium]|tara:strand:- start:14391 stop:16949 length:2559 start_codon:yes stop_codon:yes gene_type:complete